MTSISGQTRTALVSATSRERRRPNQTTLSSSEPEPNRLLGFEYPPDSQRCCVVPGERASASSARSCKRIEWQTMGVPCRHPKIFGRSASSLCRASDNHRPFYQFCLPARSFGDSSPSASFPARNFAPRAPDFLPGKNFSEVRGSNLPCAQADPSESVDRPARGVLRGARHAAFQPRATFKP